ncbi:hypothetical protein BC936DRAFT_143876 [Jimgerdemannia flammicorona]|uniref:Uncharacterized protein n=1 Tax=Jimgerdemannia flammicorona TaxID=994334 RepID=A0A432ZYD6_9FUNG|nr:hypothetical protein BC936DRAFT_143876 [Jimgerdemannia flammicorona]
MALKPIPTGATFCMLTISAFNAYSTLRLWSLSRGTLLQELSGGHTSFIYCVAVLPSGEYVSSGEDGSIRIWRAGQLVQTILQPCISVWTVTTLPNGDIACGGSDGVVRVFTRSEERTADSETVKVGT